MAGRTEFLRNLIVVPNLRGVYSANMRSGASTIIEEGSLVEKGTQPGASDEPAAGQSPGVPPVKKKSNNKRLLAFAALAILLFLTVSPRRHAANARCRNFPYGVDGHNVVGNFSGEAGYLYNDVTKAYTPVPNSSAHYRCFRHMTIFAGYYKDNMGVQHGLHIQHDEAGWRPRSATRASRAREKARTRRHQRQ